MNEAKIRAQVELEQLFSKNQLMPRLRAEFRECKEVDFVAYMTEKKIPVDFGIDLMCYMALHKRANIPTLVGLLRHHFQDAQVTADMLYKAAEADLVDWSPELRIFIVKVTVSNDVQEELDRYQYPLPMIVEPRRLSSNRQSGYLIGSSSVILRDNHTDEDVCLDHLNRMNQVKLTINQSTAMMVRNKWKNLDKPKEGETMEDFKKRKKAFEKFNRTAKDVIETIMEKSDHFYLTWRYDKRGRCYSQGYHINPQGAPWNKAIIEFAEKEMISG